MAVPLGASFFERWCISTTSRSKPGPRISAAFRVSQNNAFTPVEKFDDQTIGICEASWVIWAFSVSEWPVVPMTIPFLCTAQRPATEFVTW